MRLTARQDGRKIDGPLMNSLPENESNKSRICGYFFHLACRDHNAKMDTGATTGAGSGS
jgi:hypothetical protein